MHLAEPFLRFANWRYDQAAGRLVLAKTQQQIKLEPRLHQLLNYFLSHPMQVISKDQLMDDVWPEGEGTDAAVMRAVASLRKILQPGLVDVNSCIETLSKRGYRWTIAVETEQVAYSMPAPIVLPVEMPQAPPLLWPEARMHQADTTLPKIESADKAHPQPRRSRWPLVLASAVLVILLLFGFALFLLNAGQQARQPVFSQLLNLSALKGQERSALLSADAATMFYQYQLPGQFSWQWLRQDVKNHKKMVSPHTFTEISTAVWLGSEHLLFQASREGDCYFYRQHIDLVNKAPERLQPCSAVVIHGLVRDKQYLYWLASEAKSGVVQLWQQSLVDLNSRSGDTATLLYQFTGQYRQPILLYLQDQVLYITVEKDFYSNSLFRFDLHSLSMDWLKDFAFSITDISSWHGPNLLFSSHEALLLYPLQSGKVIRLPTVQGAFLQAELVDEQLLTAYLDGGNSDLAPLYLGDHIEQVSGEAPWLHSSKNEHQLAASEGLLAFVSERSGQNQIWWYQQGQLRQLTHLQGQRQIQQLVWWQQQLYALIDLQLYQISLHDGSLTLQDLARPARLAACGDYLYWTQWTEQGWQLWRRQPDEDDELLLHGVVDVRCAANQQLVLQRADSAVLQLWRPGSAQFLSLNASINWRTSAPEQWLTRFDALYWLTRNEGKTQLFRLPWDSTQPEQLALASGVTPTALFGDFVEGNLYYQSEQQKQSDIVWLIQANKTQN